MDIQKPTARERLLTAALMLAVVLITVSGWVSTSAGERIQAAPWVIASVCLIVASIGMWLGRN
jgi:Co/Zn/Cd efflux system component